MPGSLQNALAWLHAQAADLLATIGNIAANRAEPARQVVTDTLVTITVLWIALRVVSKKAKS